MSGLASSLSLNLTQLLQKKLHINDLQYDYCSKYLAVCCRSQSGPEILVLEKDLSSGVSASLRVVNTITTRCDPVLLFWAPPQFGRVLIVALSDNSVVYYKHHASNAGGTFSVFHETKTAHKSISCMSVGVSPAGELLCALGSPSGNVAVIFSDGSYECVNFQAHYGGVTSLSFMNSEGCIDASSDGGQCLLATGGLDNCVKIWQLTNRSFQVLSTLTIRSESKCLFQVRSIAWSKNGVMLAVASASELFVFEHVMEGSSPQRISLPKASSKVSVAFSNDRLVVSCDGEGLIYCRDDHGAYALSGILDE
ncbi:hypothetical protein X943_002880 [Babesia divergens]|uniref:Protein transport protein SEC13 n=1 Tax=Babesia divergens TaxID=32595 RepID=A0AAD9G7H1_BABDI|nr:hypothetical protein X943_002880 [Babesia divergens]